MRITNFLRLSNYIQIQNSRLVSKPFPLLTIINKKDKEKDKEKDKDKDKDKDKNKDKEGFPWE